MTKIEMEINQNRQKAASLLDSYRKQLDEIVADPMRSPLAKNIEIEKLYEHGSQTMKSLRENELSIVKKGILSHQKYLFGYDAQADIEARRGADDRADALLDEGQALAAQAKAIRNSDSFLQKAIARKAFESNWRSVLTNFVEAKPEANERLRELASLQRYETNPAGLVLSATHYMMVKPSKIS